FSTATDATAGTPGSAGLTSYDKPWLAVDNYADNSKFGTMYLAYTFRTTSGSRIMITSLAPGASSWPNPLNSGDPPGLVVDNVTPQVHAAQVLVEPNHSVDVIYI